MTGGPHSSRKSQVAIGFLRNSGRETPQKRFNCFSKEVHTASVIYIDDKKGCQDPLMVFPGILVLMQDESTKYKTCAVLHQFHSLLILCHSDSKNRSCRCFFIFNVLKKSQPILWKKTTSSFKALNLFNIFSAEGTGLHISINS